MEINERSGLRRYKPGSAHRSWLVLLLPQLSVQEVRGGLVAPHPALPQQEIMDFIRKDDLLEGHILLSQALHQVRGLLERHVTIIVAMNQQHGRFPCTN